MGAMSEAAKTTEDLFPPAYHELIAAVKAAGGNCGARHVEGYFCTLKSVFNCGII